MDLNKISYNLIQIKALGFSIDIPKEFNLDDRIADSTIFFNLDATISGDLSEEIIDVLIDYALWIGQKKQSNRNQELTSIIVRNRFSIKNLERHLKENNGHLPDGFKEFIVGASIGHARGIHAEKIQGTPLEGGYLPFIEVDYILEELISSEIYE